MEEGKGVEPSGLSTLAQISSLVYRRWRYLPIFLDLYVSNCESQLLHIKRRFFNLWSLFLPLIWSKISGIGLFSHSGPIPQIWQKYSIRSSLMILARTTFLAVGLSSLNMVSLLTTIFPTILSGLREQRKECALSPCFLYSVPQCGQGTKVWPFMFPYNMDAGLGLEPRVSFRWRHQKPLPYH